MDGLTEGRMVHYVLPEGRSQGEHRPAIITWVINKDEGYVNMTVFTDHTNDFEANEEGHDGMLWATSVNYDENKSEGTWHWMERA